MYMYKTEILKAGIGQAFDENMELVCEECTVVWKPES